MGVSGSLQPVQDGAGVNTALSLSTAAATINGTLTITGDLIITGGGIQIQDLIDDTVASLIQNGTGITWTYNDGARTLTGNFTGTTSVVPEGTNLYYTQGRFDSAFAAKSTTNLAEGTNLYFTTARGNANFATNLAASDTDDLAEGATNLYYTNTRARTALSVTAGTGLSYNNTTGVFNLAAIPNASLTNSSITINGQAVSLGGTVTLTTTNIGEGTNLYWTEARGNANFATNLAASTTTNLAEGTNLYYTQARFDTAFSNKSTTNLAEGTNLYYTQARFNSALAAKTTTDLAEGTNLYYTDARARLALSSSATGLSYANNSGVFSLTAGYAIPTTVKLGQYDTAYNRSIVSAAVTGTGTKTLSLTQQDANVVTATWTDQGITTINGTANQITATTVANTTTLAFTNDVTMPNNLVVSGNLTINGTATYVNTQSISAKDPLFEVANDNNTTDAVDIGYYGRYYDTPQTRVEFTGLFRDASDSGKFKFFTGLVDEPTNVVNTTGTGYTVGTLVANFEGNLAGTANAANVLSTARTIAASGDATWSVSFDGSANVSSALTLANTGVTATTYGTSTSVPTIAVDAKGRITSASNTNISFPVTTVNGFAGTVVLTTSDVAEGTNQYFTTARAQAAITGGASSVVTANLTASRALVSDGSGKIAASATTTTTEIGYLAGVTSALQTQIDSKLSTATAASTYLTISNAASTYLALSGGTLTGGLSGTTGTFSGILTTPQVKAATSAGLSINANSGTQVADFGAGGGANITLFGGLSGTSATFSGLITSTVGNGGTLLKSTSATTGLQVGVDLRNTGGVAQVGVESSVGGTFVTGSTAYASIFGSGNATAAEIQTNGTVRLSISSTGSSTFTTTSAVSAIFNSTDANGGYLSFRRSNTNIGFLGNSAQLGGGVLNALELRADNDLFLTTTSGSLRMASTGLSTFANTVRINGEGQSLLIFPTTTNSVRIQIQSSGGGNMVIGTDSSSGGSLASGTSAYASVFSSGSTRDLILGTNSVARVTIGGSSGNVGIGMASYGDMRLVVRGATSNSSNFGLRIENSGASNLFQVRNDGLIETALGTGTVYSTGGALSVVSDMNLKIEDGYIDNALEKVLNLKPRYFHWKEESKLPTDLRQLGFYAQEVNLALGEEAANTPKENEYFGINDRAIIAFLTKAIQEQQAQIEELKAMIAAK